MNWPGSSQSTIGGGFSSRSLSSGSSGSNNAFNNNLGFNHQHQQQQLQQQQQQGQQQYQHQNNNNNGMSNSNAGFGFGGSIFNQSNQSNHMAGGQQQQQQQQQQYQPQQQQYGNVVGSFGGPGSSSQSHFNGYNSGSGSFNGGFSSGHGQPYGQQNGFANSSSSGGGGQNHPGSGSNNGAATVGRYLPGYLTGSSLSGSPRFSNSQSNTGVSAAGETRSSPESYARELASPSSSSSHALPGSSSSTRLFGAGGGYSSTSSSGTAAPGGARDSPSRSPKTSLFSNSAYGSSRSLMLGSGAARGRQSSGSTLGGGGAMDEDAPPTDTLDEFDDGPGAAVGAGSVTSPGPSSAALIATSHRSANVSSSSPSMQSQSLPPASASSGAATYKITIFGFPSHLSSSVISHFASISPIVYNSLDASSKGSSGGGAGEPEQVSGANWVTIGYESEWAALRALRRNGDIVGGNVMIGVRRADGSGSNSGSSSGAFPPVSSTAEQQQQPETQQTVSAQTSRQSTFGTPARVLPASAAWRAPATGGKLPGSPSKASTVGRIAELGSGRLDPKIFKEDEKAEGKPSSGVVGTLSNLIFGF